MQSLDCIGKKIYDDLIMPFRLKMKSRQEDPLKRIRGKKSNGI